MRATQAVAGLQIGEDAVSLRVEAYLKRYRDLAQLTRDYTVVASGSGRARGIDIFFKVPLPLGFTTRETFSVLSARRSDPNTGVMARAPFDISSSQTLIVEHASPFGIRTGLAYRAATGRPITPVTSAHYDPAQNLYLPEYGAPMSERLPALRRLDLSFSRYRPLGRGWSGVLYVSLSNVLNRENVYDYRYSTDYRQRFPIRSIFNRAVYVGASLLRS
jgi:hypothetical protein